ncbi:MAG: hypothetical protein Q9212_004577, partial [Teloschistes hypoglaucus]
MTVTASPSKPILIIGAGISGLATARLLTEHRIPNIVFEASSADRGQGYAISLHEWAFKPLLADLGNLPITQLQKAVAPDRQIGGLGWIDQAMRDVSTGETLMAPGHEQPEGGCEEQPVVFRSNRNALRQWLCDVGEEEVDVRYEHKLISFSGSLGNVKAEFEHGAIFQGSMVIAADGLHSTVRKILLPHITPEVLPAVVFHGDLRLSHQDFNKLLRPHMQPANSPSLSNILAGVGDSFNTPITISNITPSKIHLDWSYSRAALPTNDPLFNPTRTVQEAKVVPDALLEEIAGRTMASPFGEIIGVESIRERGCYNWLSCSVFVPREEGLKRGLEKGVVFMGDSAHAMPIFGGEGGNHALLDAVEFVREFVGHEGGGAMELEAVANGYYDSAYRRTQGAVRRCRQRFLLLHRPIGQWRELAVKRDQAAGE